MSDRLLDYFKKSLAILMENGNKSGEGRTLNNMAAIAIEHGDYAPALIYLEKSLVIQQQINDKSGEGATLSNISKIYKARDDYVTALAYLEKSLAIRREIGDKSGEGTAFNNMATITYTRGDFAAALDYMNKALAIQQQIGNEAGLCATLFNMGYMYWQNAKQDEAMRLWLKSYGIAKKINLAQTLDTMEKLAKDIGLPGGLAGWEALAHQMGEVNMQDVSRIHISNC